MSCVGRATRRKNQLCVGDFCALLHWRMRRNDEEAMTNKPLSHSLTWEGLAAQISKVQESSNAEVAAWERVIGNARRGSLGGAEKRTEKKKTS